MKTTISIGSQSFEYMRMNGSFYIDKTGFIKEWWENQDIATLITRPRRFGKTLNLSMRDADRPGHSPRAYSSLWICV